MGLLSWLSKLELYPKVYWKDRSSAVCCGGAGFGPLATGERFGWRHFAPTKAPHWSDFPSQFSFSPQLFKEMEAEDELECKSPLIKAAHFNPGKTQWLKMVETALNSIQNKRLDKLVLGREYKIDLELPIDPWPIVSQLVKRATHSTVFCIQPTPRSAFLGASPERLFFRTQDQLETEAIAGTRKLGDAEELELIGSVKEGREFSLVEESIRKALAPLLKRPLQFSPRTIRKTSIVQHLYSQMKTAVKLNTSDSRILDRLHPTGALLGFPKSRASKLLSQLEPFERGLYGAPLGRMRQNLSEWIVGIRSCLLFESTARLYSAAGIVAASDPEAEWSELDLKLQLFKGIFL